VNSFQSITFSLQGITLKICSVNELAIQTYNIYANINMYGRLDSLNKRRRTSSKIPGPEMLIFAVLYRCHNSRH
jgi:hypothetical protein